MHKATVVSGTRERPAYGLLGDRRMVTEKGWRVRIQLTRSPASTFESVQFYETKRGAFAAAERISNAAA